jgi:hypothetical protein
MGNRFAKYAALFALFSMTGCGSDPDADIVGPPQAEQLADGSWTRVVRWLGFGKPMLMQGGGTGLGVLAEAQLNLRAVQKRYTAICERSDGSVEGAWSLPVINRTGEGGVLEQTVTYSRTITCVPAPGKNPFAHAIEVQATGADTAIELDPGVAGVVEVQAYAKQPAGDHVPLILSDQIRSSPYHSRADKFKVRNKAPVPLLLIVRAWLGHKNISEGYLASLVQGVVHIQRK